MDQEDRRFRVYFYYTHPVADPDYYDSVSGFDELLPAEAEAKRILEVGLYRAAIICDDQGNESEYTIDDFD